MFSNETGLFKQTKEAKFLPHIILAPILAIIFMIVGQFIGVITFSLLSPLVDDSITKSLFYLSFTFLFISLLVFAWVKFIEKRDISTLGFCKENFIKKYLLGFVFGFIMFTAVIVLLSITGHVVIDKNPVIPVGISALNSIFIILPGWIIQSGTEEVVTRGWLMNVIGARYNVPIGLFVSSSLFGLLHIFNQNVSIIAIMNIILVGIFFGLYVIRTQNLWGACGLHCAWNWAQGNIFGLEVSGSSIGTGSLLKLNLTGSQWFTGGAFGPEAGFATTIILLMGIVIVFVMLKKKSSL
ncbi:CPBP family intramembrane glutamic endopeptidase [Clostridium tagluense]|uniref:CPBP family intramembrane glutamic endopeptidase n=1 Tax=Clostridium tagluense TaxID=360422 RepID=UPI001CF5821C|nr:type II CAAX endopeptidase family protein [Clostridium tagluense]MCB2297988.1 CPBP family intramembrane metalloprotease [Clostridium tagluense]